jgi:hypothetical protein
MEWELEGMPPCVPDAHFEVWKANGEVRRVWRPHYGCGPLAYEDCTRCRTPIAEMAKYAHGAC